MNTLSIDTSDNTKTSVTLLGDTTDTLEHSTESHASQVVLSLIDHILKKNMLSLDDIDEIQVNPGPGSFTGLRVGISIAQALGFAKRITINGKEIGEYPTPEYT